MDGHPIVRAGIVWFLSQAPNMQIVAEAGNCQEALAKVVSYSPEVVLMDVETPDGDGLELIRRLCEARPGIRVLIFSSSGQVEQVRHMLQSGARGFITKCSPGEEVLQAVQRVHTGEAYFSDNVAQTALLLFVNRTGATEALLSLREREVLTQIAEGLGNKQIAGVLRLSTRTIETHRERIMKKLGIYNVAGLTRFALAKGYAAIRDCQPSGLAY